MAPHWRDSLPTVRGRYSPDARLAEQTWFRVGGPADILYRPADRDDLAHFLAHKPDVLVNVIGSGSNLLVRDGGVPGIVIRLGRGFSDIRFEGNLVYVGAACLDRTVSLSCLEGKKVSGLEFLVGIPGTIGGAIRMNAGAYGREMKDILVYADVLDLEGKAHQLTPNDLQMTYRHSNLPEGWIVTGAVLKGEPEDPVEISKALEDILRKREASQPIRGRTGGSTFKNPGQEKAWKLIDAAGCRGLKIGGAQVSKKHCNFLLNLDQATAHDLESLGEEVRQRVQKMSGIALEWEIIRLGRTAKG